MMPPPTLVTNPLMNRRSSSNLQLILPDNLKTEVLDENSENSMLSDNSMQSIPTPTATANGAASVASPLQQLVNENSREAASTQADIMRTVAVATAGTSPVRDVAVSGLLGVVDLIRTQHPLSMVNAHHPTSFAGGRSTHIFMTGKASFAYKALSCSGIMTINFIVIVIRCLKK